MYGPGRRRLVRRAPRARARAASRRPRRAARPASTPAAPSARPAGRRARARRTARRPCRSAGSPSRPRGAPLPRARPSSLDDAVAAGQVLAAAHVLVAEPAQQPGDLLGPPVADLEHEVAAGTEHLRGRRARSPPCAPRRPWRSAAPSRAPRARASRSPRRSRTAGSRRRGRKRPRDRRGRRARRRRTLEPARAAFSRATASASAETSIAVTRAPGCSSAIASAIAPEPVPTSSTAGPVEPAQELEAALDHRPPSRDAGRARAGRPSASGGGTPTRRGCTRAAPAPRAARPGARARPTPRRRELALRSRRRARCG